MHADQLNADKRKCRPVNNRPEMQTTINSNSNIFYKLDILISVLGSTYASNVNRIHLLQKKVIRIISKSAFDTHTDSLFVQFKILIFHDI